MCVRVIQSSGPLGYGIVEGMDMRDGRAHNYPPRWNAAPSQEIRSGEREWLVWIALQVPISTILRRL